MNANSSDAWILAKKKSRIVEKQENTRPVAKAVLAEIFPEGMGLNLVLSILESIILSCHIFRIAEPEAPKAIKINEIPLIYKLWSEGAKIIAQRAVKITSEITPGLIKT